MVFVILEPELRSLNYFADGAGGRAKSHNSDRWIPSFDLLHTEAQSSPCCCFSFNLKRVLMFVAGKPKTVRMTNQDRESPKLWRRIETLGAKVVVMRTRGTFPDNRNCELLPERHHMMRCRIYQIYIPITAWVMVELPEKLVSRRTPHGTREGDGTFFQVTEVPIPHDVPTLASQASWSLVFFY